MGSVYGIRLDCPAPNTHADCRPTVHFALWRDGPVPGLLGWLAYQVWGEARDDSNLLPGCRFINFKAFKIAEQQYPPGLGFKGVNMGLL